MRNMFLSWEMFFFYAVRINQSSFFVVQDVVSYLKISICVFRGELELFLKLVKVLVPLMS